MKKKIRSPLRDERGNVAVIAAIAIVPLILAAGVALDFSSSESVRSDLQASVDSAALAAIASGETAQSAMTQIADSYFRTNFSANQPGLQAAVSTSYGADTINVSAVISIDTAFMKLVGKNSIDVNASATATKRDGDPVCMLSLDPSGRAAIEIQGSANFVANDCYVHTNSRHDKGLDSHTGTANPATAGGFCAVGGHVGTGFSPTPESNCKIVDDPFADLPWPAITSCDETDLVIKKETRTLHPGTYCGGLNLGTNANVTFAAGTYVIKDGPFVIGSQASAHGENVAFVLTGTNTSIQLNSGADIDLDAHESGDYRGILFAQNPASNPGGESDIQGGSNMSIVGSIYLPTQKLDIGGGGDLTIVSSHTPLVASQFAIRGNSIDISLDPNLFPGTDNVAKVNEFVRLIR